MVSILYVQLYWTVSYCGILSLYLIMWETCLHIISVSVIRMSAGSSLTLMMVAKYSPWMWFSVFRYRSRSSLAPTGLYLALNLSKRWKVCLPFKAIGREKRFRPRNAHKKKKGKIIGIQLCPECWNAAFCVILCNIVSVFQDECLLYVSNKTRSVCVLVLYFDLTKLTIWWECCHSFHCSYMIFSRHWGAGSLSLSSSVWSYRQGWQFSKWSQGTLQRVPGGSPAKWQIV